MGLEKYKRNYYNKYNLFSLKLDSLYADVKHFKHFFFYEFELLGLLTVIVEFRMIRTFLCSNVLIIKKLKLYIQRIPQS